MGFWEGVQKNLQRANCAVAGFGEWYASASVEAVQNVGVVDGIPIEELVELQAEILTNWKRFVCSRLEPDLPIALTPPFTGGQCNNLVYQPFVDISYTDFTGVRRENQSSFVGSTLQGKITKMNLVETQATFNTTRLSIEFGNELGQVIVTEITSSLRFPNPELSVNQVIAVPTSGTDNCGNPPPQGLPPTNGNPFDYQTDIEYEDENGTPQTLSGVNVQFRSPFIDENGNIVFGVGLDLGDGRTIDGTMTYPSSGSPPYFSPSSPVAPFTSGGASLDPAIGFDENGNPLSALELAAIQPNQALLGKEVTEEEEEKASELPIIGVFVVSERVGGQPSSTGQLIPNYKDFPKIITPNCAKVSFIFREGAMEGLTLPININVASCYVPAPPDIECIAVRVEFFAGWKGKYTVRRGKRTIPCEASTPVA